MQVWSIKLYSWLTVDLKVLIKPDNDDVDQSFVSFLMTFNSILDIYNPLTQIFFFKKVKLRTKAWITLGLQK